MTTQPTMTPSAFAAKWKGSQATEKAAAQDAGRSVSDGILHREATAGAWYDLSVMEQMGNVGTEVGRAARAKEAGKDERAWNALVRVLELFDLTIADGRRRAPRRREICRICEVVWTSWSAPTRTLKPPNPSTVTSCHSRSPDGTLASQAMDRVLTWT